MIPVVIPVATKVTKSSHVTDEGGSSPEKSAHLAAQNIGSEASRNAEMGDNHENSGDCQFLHYKTPTSRHLY
jgi:hypothetical protein